MGGGASGSSARQEPWISLAPGVLDSCASLLVLYRYCGDKGPVVKQNGVTRFASVCSSARSNRSLSFRLQYCEGRAPRGSGGLFRLALLVAQAVDRCISGEQI